jgi:hypothetical protein
MEHDIKKKKWKTTSKKMEDDLKKIKKNKKQLKFCFPQELE